MRQLTMSLQKGVKALLTEFDDIKKQTQAIGTTPKTAFDANPTKNRYKGTVEEYGSGVW